MTDIPRFDVKVYDQAGEEQETIRNLSNPQLVCVVCMLLRLEIRYKVTEVV